jgi:hypothetical protein
MDRRRGDHEVVRVSGKSLPTTTRRVGRGVLRGAHLNVEAQASLMLVSVLISNHNYARFLREAIDSALAQTHPAVEIVVVDDGSTDASRDVIAAYGDRIVATSQENAGQTAALNAAFAHSHGELVCTLDSDDAFEADKVARVVAAAQAAPQAQLIHHQLQIVDADGNVRHAPFPRRVLDGDLRARTLRAGGWFLHGPSSGLAYRRAYAERLFPVPTHRGGLRVEVDTYLAGPAALLAPVAGIQAPLTRYRIHGDNRSQTELDLDAQLLRLRAEVETLSEVMDERFGRPVALDVEEHFEYQLLRCARGAVSRPRTVGRLLRSSALPLSLRSREALRVLANRGAAARA